MILPHAIDQLRTLLWVEEILEQTGDSSIYSLASRLDPKSIWIDGAGIPHQSKWYRLARGEQVPSIKLAQQIKSQLPRCTFEVHHPVWYVLRRPDSSARTRRRLQSRMPKNWRDVLKSFTAHQPSNVKLNIGFVTHFRLEDFTFLDALFLFESMRHHAVVTGNHDCLVITTAMLLSLPLIYVDDWIWWRNDLDRINQILAVIDLALACNPVNDRLPKFPAEEQALAISILQDKMLRYLSKHPTGLGTPKVRRRYLERLLNSPINVSLRIATSAFVPASAQPLDQLNPFDVPVDERFWRWAWYMLELGDSRSRKIDLREVQEVFETHLSRKGD